MKQNLPLFILSLAALAFLPSANAFSLFGSISAGFDQFLGILGLSGNNNDEQEPENKVDLEENESPGSPLDIFIDTLVGTAEDLTGLDINGDGNAGAGIFTALENFLSALVPGTNDVPGINAMQDMCETVISQLDPVVDYFEDLPGISIPELHDISEKLQCNCGLDLLGGTMNVDCNYKIPVCINIDTIEYCGFPSFIGRYGFNGLPGILNLKSTTCFTFTNDNGDRMNKICLKGKHGASISNIAALGECETAVYEVDGTKRNCNSCTVCDGGKGAMFDCSNVDLDPSPSSSYFIPSFGDLCMSVGLLDRVERGYRPFMIPVE